MATLVWRTSILPLGLKPQFDLHHVLSGERTLDQIVIEGLKG